MVNRSLRIVGGLVFFSSLLWTILQPSEISVLVTSLGLAIGVLSTSNNRATNLHPKYRALIYCCCFVTLNIALYMVVSKYELVFDTTPAKNHTLQPQTINFLRDLKTPIHIVSFLEPQSPAEIHFANLIDRFQTQTNQITLEFVNPITNPERSETFQELLPQGSIFLQTNGKTTPLPFSDLSEQGLLNNIVQVTSNSHRICFIYGHGEADPKDVYTTYDAGLIVAKLEMQNYNVQQIMIHNTGAPEECEIIVIADPKKDFSKTECEYINQHIENGRHLLVLLSPKNKPNLITLLSKYGFVIDANKIVERSTYLQTQRGYLLDSNQFIHHPIMETISKYPIELAALHTVDVDPSKNRTAQYLAQTTEKSERQTQTEHDTGPFPVISYAQFRGEKSKSEAQIVVVGNGDLAANLFVANAPGNAYFFLNTIAWMAEEEGQLTTRMPQIKNIQITRYQTFTIWLLSLILVPGILLYCGVYFRRNRG